MATTKFKLRTSTISGNPGTLFVQVIHQRVARQVSTKYKLYPNEWDTTKQSVVITTDTPPDRSQYLHALHKALQHDTTRLQLITLTLDHSRTTYTAQDIITRYLRQEPSDDFTTFAETLINAKRAEGRHTLAAKYQTTLNSLNRFLDGLHLTFDNIDTPFIHRYETYLKKHGLCPNTTSFYLRNLRAIYNHATQQGLTPQQPHPFTHVYTGIAKTIKRAINIRELQKLKSHPLPPHSTDDFARDIFLFSLYTCGMSLTDIAHLKKSDLQGDYLTYCRQKTGQRINIRWHPCMQQLVDKYKRDDTPYLIPIITHPGEDEAKQYQNQIHLINRHLKKLGKTLGLSSKLTTYVARHSWASIAKSQDVPVSAISEAMGHTTERTTHIYLKSFGITPADHANQKVLNAII